MNCKSRSNWDFGDAGAVGCEVEEPLDGSVELPLHAVNSKPGAINNKTKTEFVILLSILILEGQYRPR